MSKFKQHLEEAARVRPLNPTRNAQYRRVERARQQLEAEKKLPEKIDALGNLMIAVAEYIRSP